MYKREGVRPKSEYNKFSFLKFQSKSGQLLVVGPPSLEVFNSQLGAVLQN